MKNEFLPGELMTYELVGFMALCTEPGGLSKNLKAGDRVEVPGMVSDYVSGILWQSGVEYAVTRPLKSPGKIVYEIIDPHPKPAQANPL